MDIEYCTDAIAFYGDKLVLVERLNNERGLALPGGRCEKGEALSDCIIREFAEETGLILAIDSTWSTYADPRRDPRGRKVTTVFAGCAYGVPRGEKGKTKVCFMNLSDIESLQERFAFDHFEIINDYLRSIS